MRKNGLRKAVKTAERKKRGCFKKMLLSATGRKKLPWTYFNMMLSLQFLTEHATSHFFILAGQVKKCAKNKHWSQHHCTWYSQLYDRDDIFSHKTGTYIGGNNNFISNPSFIWTITEQSKVYEANQKGQSIHYARSFGSIQDGFRNNASFALFHKGEQLQADHSLCVINLAAI